MLAEVRVLTLLGVHGTLGELVADYAEEGLRVVHDSATWNSTVAAARFVKTLRQKVDLATRTSALKLQQQQQRRHRLLLGQHIQKLSTLTQSTVGR